MSDNTKKNEIVFVFGYPGAGKTKYIADNYPKHQILTTSDRNCHQSYDKLLQSGRTRRIVIECNLPTRLQRSEFITKSKQYGLPIHCKWLQTSYVDSMYNVCWRFMDEFKKIINTEEIVGEYAANSNALPIGLLNYYQRYLEVPIYQEGWATIEEIPFQRKTQYGKNKGVIFTYDRVLRESTGAFEFPTKPEEVRVLPGRADRIIAYTKKGYTLLGVNNVPAIHKKLLTRQHAVACFERTNEMLGCDISWAMCPHRADQNSCYCCKPNVGLGVSFISRFSLNPAETIVVGDSEIDGNFAKNCGFQYKDHQEFFA